MKTVVICFSGKDKPGLVDQLSKIIHANNGNWQISSLHQIAGLFSGVIEVSIPQTNIDSLTLALTNFSELKFLIDTGQKTTEVEQNHLQLNITANDKNGIIKSISEVIHSHGGNLLKLESKRETAPHTGVLMFSAELSIAIAIAEEKDKLLTGLESIADDLMVDVV